MPDDTPLAARRGRIRQAAAMQAVALGLVLSGCLFAPRPGGAVLLIPLTHRQPALGPQAQTMTVLRAGAIPGSVLVQAKGAVPVVALLRHGVLALAAPSLLCARDAAKRPVRSADHG